MSEINILITIVGSILLYSLGGMFLKPIRRYGIPIFYTIMSIINNSYSLNVFIALLILCGVLHLGYGESSSWLMRIIYAIGISAPSIIIKFNFWCMILPIIFIVTYILSNKPKWQYIFNWRICEALVSAFMGVLYSQVL